ncbi:MAG: hypothetical protein KKE83_02335 [Proteobacteria bacterium]|nr:hypothetical protein [Pseudomonadota bacterium]MBU1545942.1 hypothetical protein [Pseudomonadota bacterium]MBU2618503.1 hypothetical protein [Pseudomonadota bacterium]
MRYGHLIFLFLQKTDAIALNATKGRVLAEGSNGELAGNDAPSLRRFYPGMDGMFIRRMGRWAVRFGTGIVGHAVTAQPGIGQLFFIMREKRILSRRNMPPR